MINISIPSNPKKSHRKSKSSRDLKQSLGNKPLITEEQVRQSYKSQQQDDEDQFIIDVPTSKSKSKSKSTRKSASKTKSEPKSQLKSKSMTKPKSASKNKSKSDPMEYKMLPMKVKKLAQPKDPTNFLSTMFTEKIHELRHLFNRSSSPDELKKIIVHSLTDDLIEKVYTKIIVRAGNKINIDDFLAVCSVIFETLDEKKLENYKNGNIFHYIKNEKVHRVVKQIREYAITKVKKTIVSNMKDGTFVDFTTHEDILIDDLVDISIFISACLKHLSHVHTIDPFVTFNFAPNKTNSESNVEMLDKMVEEHFQKNKKLFYKTKKPGQNFNFLMRVCSKDILRDAASEILNKNVVEDKLRFIAKTVCQSIEQMKTKGQKMTVPNMILSISDPIVKSDLTRMCDDIIFKLLAHFEDDFIPEATPFTIEDKEKMADLIYVALFRSACELKTFNETSFSFSNMETKPKVSSSVDKMIIRNKVESEKKKTKTVSEIKTKTVSETKTKKSVPVDEDESDPVVVLFDLFNQKLSLIEPIFETIYLPSLRNEIINYLTIDTLQNIAFKIFKEVEQRAKTMSRYIYENVDVGYMEYVFSNKDAVVDDVIEWIEVESIYEDMKQMINFGSTKVIKILSRALKSVGKGMSKEQEKSVVMIVSLSLILGACLFEKRDVYHVVKTFIGSEFDNEIHEMKQGKSKIVSEIYSQGLLKHGEPKNKIIRKTSVSIC